jgi:hypothetical protein
MIGSLVCGAFALHPDTGQLGLTFFFFFFTQHLSFKEAFAAGRMGSRTILME